MVRNVEIEAMMGKMLFLDVLCFVAHICGVDPQRMSQVLGMADSVPMVAVFSLSFGSVP